MQLDWRGLLSSIHVDWRDRGANCRSGNVNISCPFCGNDPSYHLAIAEQREAFYCYRDDRHSGRQFVYLLVKLGIARPEAIRLINSFMMHSQPIVREAVKQAPGHLAPAWDRFASAVDNRHAVAYLTRRGIARPEQIIARYDLRVALAGTWGRRLLIPFLSPRGDVLTWTGRGLIDDMVPKYLTQTSSDPGLIFVPDYDKRGKGCLVITEGPFDALKLAIISQDSPFIVAALTGKQLNPSRLLKLRELADGCDSVLVALDSDVNTSSHFAIISDIAGFLPIRYIGRARLPSGYKDPADLPSEGALEWLMSQRTALKTKDRQKAM
jgi:hypothetical protein